MTLDKLETAVRDIVDFPQPGIVFKDITPILADPALFAFAIDLMAEKLIDDKIDKIVGIDARGFIFGTALAHKLNIGFIPVRKPGKLPSETVSESYDLEYGSNTLEIHSDALSAGERVAIVDDLLATGGTAEATAKLVNRLGAIVVSQNFFMELGFLNGKDKISTSAIHSVLKV